MHYYIKQNKSRCQADTYENFTPTILFYLFDFLFSIILSNKLFIPIVIMMQSGINGVPGPNQNNQQALPIPKHHLEKSLPHVITLNK